MSRIIISDLERTYDEMLRAQLPEVREYVQHWAPELARHGIDVGDFRLPLRPLLYDSAAIERLETGVRELWGGLLDVYSQVFQNDPEKAAAFLETPRAFLPWLRSGQARELHVNELFGRPDGFAWGERVQLIEQNVTSGAGGMAAVEALSSFFDAFPVLLNLRKYVSLQKMSIGDAYAAYFKREHAQENVAYLDAYSPETRAPSDDEGLLFLEHLRKRGVHLQHLVYPGAQFRDEGLFVEGKRIDCLYRGEAAIALLEYLDEVVPYLDACQKQRVRMVSSVFEIILFDKQLLPFLSDEEQNGFLSSERRAAIADVLPWTRFLKDYETAFEGRRVHIPSFCREHQAQLVIKKGDGCCSNAVAMGAEQTAEEWEKLVASAIQAGGWIVQEVVNPPQQTLPYLKDTGLAAAQVTTMSCPYLIQGRVVAVAGRTSVPQGSRILVGAGVAGFQAGIRTAFAIC